jgi:hypothetical protein
MYIHGEWIPQTRAGIRQRRNQEPAYPAQRFLVKR